MAEVNKTAPAGAKENGAVQPALVVAERVANKKLAVAKMHKRNIPPRFKKGNVLDPHDPRFDIVGKENEIVAMKYRGHAPALISRSGRTPLGYFLDCY
jgi:hypothetical protein